MEEALPIVFLYVLIMVYIDINSQLDIESAARILVSLGSATDAVIVTGAIGDNANVDCNISTPSSDCADSTSHDSGSSCIAELVNYECVSESSSASNCVGTVVDSITSPNVVVPSLCDAAINEEHVMQLTGLQSIELFHGILREVICLEQSNIAICRSAQKQCSVRLLMTLFKLRHNVPFTVLGIMFNVSDRAASNYFRDMINLLYVICKECIFMPSKESIVCNMPKCFRSFQDTVIVLDCTECKIEKPRSLKSRIHTYSHYKGDHTVKILLGTAPSGMITFVSDIYGGRASDNYITEHSGVLNKCLRGVDAVMVDKGFTIDNLCRQLGVKLYRPPFLRKQKQLAKPESLFNLRIAAARVHVERAISAVKKYKIVVDKVDIDLLPYFKEIFTICCALANLGKPILANARFD